MLKDDTIARIIDAVHEYGELSMRMAAYEAAYRAILLANGGAEGEASKLAMAKNEHHLSRLAVEQWILRTLEDAQE